MAKKFLILDEACFDSALGRPAKMVVDVDNIVTIQECVFTEFVNMDKEESITGSVVFLNCGTPIALKVRNKTDEIILQILSISNWEAQFPSNWGDGIFEIKSGESTQEN